MVPVSEETRNDLREWSDEHNTTYDKLIREMMAHVDIGGLSPQERNGGKGGRTAASDKREEVIDLLESRGLRDIIESKAVRVVEDGYDDGICNARQVDVVAASAEYIGWLYEWDTEDIESREFNQQQVAEAHGVSEVSIRNCYHDLLEVHSWP